MRQNEEKKRKRFEKKSQTKKTLPVDKIYHEETKCIMKINISNKNLNKDMNEDCKSSEKNNINFTVQSLACMISIHNILTSYVDDSRFQNNQKIPLE